MSSDQPTGQDGAGAHGSWQPAPPPGYGYAPLAHPAASTVLVLGILGLVLCPVLGPFAWVRGNRALAEIDAQPGRWSGRDQVQTGRLLGIVGSVLLGLAVLFLLGMLLLFGVLATLVSTTGF